MKITAYLLPPAQIERLREAGGPLNAEACPDLGRLTEASVCVVEVDGRIVGYWPAFYALHLEPLWITDEFRKHPGVAKALFTLMTETVEIMQEPVSFAILDPATGPETVQFAERLGFARVPGDLYYVMAPAAQPAGG